MMIRPALPSDSQAISVLINGLAHHFMLDPGGHGAERFLQSISPSAIHGYITAPNFRCLVAMEGPDIVGVASLRDGTHLFHLFVATSHQKRGIARALWDALKSEATTHVEHFTVNSSPHAVAVYERFGFSCTGPRTELNGIAFFPMRV
jgi:GNAT superfamily N-acetyltransferase